MNKLSRTELMWIAHSLRDTASEYREEGSPLAIHFAETYQELVERIRAMAEDKSHKTIKIV